MGPQVRIWLSSYSEDQSGNKDTVRTVLTFVCMPSSLKGNKLSYSGNEPRAVAPAGEEETERRDRASEQWDTYQSNILLS